MNNQEINELWDRYKEGKSTPDDLALLESWYISFEQKESNSLSEKEIADRLAAIRKKLPLNHPQHTSIRIWQRLSIAAAIVFCFGMGIFYYVQNYNQSLSDNTIVKKDIPPGKNKAYLTLANGSKISLTDASNGDLARQAGINITKTANGKLVYKTTGSKHFNITEQNIEYNTIETPRGGQYQVILPDGSRVWLNSASSIKFPLNFNGLAKRRIELNGEAYFEVTKNKHKPFTVTTSNQEITVLGTHFNINSYADESVTKTTLLEGSIKVSTLHDLQKKPAKDIGLVLKPGQQSLLSSNRLTMQEADIDEAIAWKQGYFRFNDEKLESIMRKVSRWYDVDVEYENTELKNKSFAGVTTRFANVSKLFRMLELTNEVRFKIDGKKIKVLDKNNQRPE